MNPSLFAPLPEEAPAALELPSCELLMTVAVLILGGLR